MKTVLKVLLTVGLSAMSGLCFAQKLSSPSYSWRYYRPGNTGIQGDFCEALWIGADGNPWIGGYDPGFEEGGIAKFVQAENRWINVSNVDYPEIGHPEQTGVSRVSEIVTDASGTLWMATWRGALKYNPALGPSSLKRYDAANSGIPGGRTTDVELAPDGTLWFSAYSTVWGDGGVVKFTPATNTWARIPAMGALSVQPRPGGGYYVWTLAESTGHPARFDSVAKTWTYYTETTGAPGSLPGKACTDAAGNTWMQRLTDNSYALTTLDCLRPNGTWIGVPAPPNPNDIWAFRAFGNGKALLVDGSNTTWYFDGTQWLDKGSWREGAYTYDVYMDNAGNIWVCGIGGAAKRDAFSGNWQRYRVTNTSQFDFFNNDLTLGADGTLYACANAGSGVGGMVAFDGIRWTGYNLYNYGLGHEWPFNSDNSQSVYVRPSNGQLVVNPMNEGLFSLDSGVWNSQSGSSTVKSMIEDSSGRLWALGEYYDLKYLSGGLWTDVGIVGWGSKIQRDPSRPNTIFAMSSSELRRTDGTYLFTRTTADFPDLDPAMGSFSGLAVGQKGLVWIGAWAGNEGAAPGALIRMNTDTGAYSVLRSDQKWPFLGQYVQPLAVTPDGRVWMQYDSDYLVAKRGLCWYDGKKAGHFPAPPGGEAQWGGLPHAAIYDLEVKVIPGGYELWMSCASRGIAVLTVRYGKVAQQP